MPAITIRQFDEASKRRLRLRAAAHGRSMEAEAGSRRTRLTEVATEIFGRIGTCLPLTTEAADRYAEIRLARRSQGRPIGGFDALIAAIALEASLPLATRDLDGFRGLGLELVDPGDSRSSR